MQTQRESMPWLREREGHIWTAEDTEHVERLVAEVETIWERMYLALSAKSSARLTGVEVVEAIFHE